MGQDQGGKTFQDRDRKEEDHVRIGERSSQSSNVNRTECRESSAAESQYRLAPAGTGTRDTRARRWRNPVDEEIDQAVDYINSKAELSRLSADQEKLIHQEMALKIAEVEDGLSKLPKRNALLKNQPNLVSPNNSRHSHSRPLDLLEVYCGPNSQITHHIIKRGGRAMRFTCDDGDLGTVEGVQKLWLWIYLYEPRHIWLAPECRLWGKFSNLNMSKSLELHDKIVRQRVENRHHLQLCNEIYLYQTSKRRHVHLEQPSESVMLEQPELADLKDGTLPSVFDMCKVGKLKMPQSQLYLQKRTKVNTSSGYLDHHLHERYCDKDHEHVVIQGSMKHDGKHMNVSTYAAAYTSSFGSFVADKILRECVLCEPPVVLFQEPDDVFAVGEKHEAPDPAPEDSQCQKRRRHGIKGPPRGSDLDTGPSPPSSRYGKKGTIVE